MTRSVEELTLEVDYLRSILAELGELNELVPTASEAVTVAAQCLVPLSLSAVTDADMAAIETVADCAKIALGALSGIIARTGHVGRLIDGRIATLYDEAGIGRDGAA